MSSFSDEPVLVKPTASGSWKRWLAIIATLGIAAAALYIPFNHNRMEELAHDAKRGPRGGAIYPVTIETTPHTIELGWGPGGQFAPVLDPAPPAGATLRLQSRLGRETLAWNKESGCFGPTTFGGVDPYAHHQLDLRLELEGRPLWSDTLRAYGIHESHNH